MIPRLVALLITVIFAIAALSASEHAQPNAGTPLVQADYQRCITVRPGPINPTRKPALYPNLSELT